MLRIAVIGDVHDHQERLERVLEPLGRARADLSVLVGDVGKDPPWLARRVRRRAHDQSVRRVIGRVREALDCPLVFVPGNHDMPDAVEDTAGINCDGRVVELAGLQLAGLGGAGPTRFGFPYEWREDEAEQRLRRMFSAGARTDIFVCHTPPAGTTLDRTYRGRHVGSAAVRRWIESARPKLFVCGHIHEGWGFETVEGVPCLNAGALGEPHGQAIAWIVDWSGGRPAGIRSYRETPEGGTETRELEL